MKKFTFFAKAACVLLAISILPLTSFSQHFTPVPNNSTGNWHFYTVYANLLGAPLVAGDEIAVFDGNICVGAHTLTAALDSTYGLALANNWMAYEMATGLPGYTGGNTYTFKCWNGTTEYLGTMVYDATVGTGNYVGANFPPSMNFVWSFVGLTFNSVAPLSGNLSGTVEDVAGDSISGVTVTATKGGTVYTATTNSNGYYSLPNIDEGTYTIATSHALYQDGGPLGATIAAATPAVTNFDGGNALVYKVGVLEGFVYDQAATIVVGATITLTPSSANDDTDGTGAYEIPGIAPGTYTATVTEPNYANTVVTGLVINPNDTTLQDFTIYASGTLSGTVTDGNNGGANEDGVLVTVVETGDFVTTAGGGGFSFNLPTGTYSLTFTKDGFHDGASSGIVVTLGGTTIADKEIYSYFWEHVNGDPFSQTWTIYLNTVTGDGTPLKAGDELSIWNLNSVPVQMVGVYYFDGPINGAGTTHDLIAFSEIYGAPDPPGYFANETYEFRLKYQGSAVYVTALVDSTWITGSGLISPDPADQFPAGTVFSMVDLDFDITDGDLDVLFEDEGSNAPDADINLTLYKGSTQVATATFASGATAYLNFPALSAGDYTLVATSTRFVETSYTNISIAPGTTTIKDFVINHIASETQDITFGIGYQLVSRRVGVDDFNAATIGDPLTNDEDNWLKNEGGEFYHYVTGAPGSWTPDPYSWMIKNAYNLYAENTGTISFTSIPIAYNADITINGSGTHAGASLISYLPGYVLDADVAFASLKVDELDFIMNTDGQTLRKVSGSWVDHIGNCSPGEGFYVKWADATGVTFNYPAETKGAAIQTEDAELTHFDFNGGDPMHNVFTLYIEGGDLEIGDEIAAFDGSTLVGAIVITSNDYLGNAMPIFSKLGGDQQGYLVGNNITLKAWKQNDNEYFFMNFTNLNEDDGKYSYVGTTYPDGEAKYSIVDVTLSPAGIIDNLAEYINIYPNPSMGYVTISSPEQIDRLMLVNLVGQTLIDLKPETGNTELNLDGFNPGVYFVNLIIDGQRITKKLTIQ